MHHKKKRKLFVLYSIPINLCRKYLVSYSIPLACIGVLFLGSIVFVNPSVSNKSYAVEVNDNHITKDAEEIDEEAVEEENNDGALESTEDNVDNELTVLSDDGNIMPLSDTITFSIGGAERNEEVEAGVDKTAYRSHTVSIGISNAEDYYLMISGHPNLTTTSGSTVISGIAISNVRGEDIPAGQWGYGWDYTGSKSNEEMTYVAMPAANMKINDISGLVDGVANINGKLVFAAKFPNNAALGNYTSNVTLTLVVTPKTNTGSGFWRDETGAVTVYGVGTTTMQGIEDVNHGADGGFCKNNSKIGEGWTAELRDNRGAEPVTYTVVKLNGDCWMGQNLALSGPLTLTNADSDVADDWMLPTDTASWDTGDYNAAQVKIGSASLSNWKQGYGNYYSWSAATAGTGTTSVVGKDAGSSICPKGWKLPPNSGTNSYTDLVGSYRSLWLTDQAIVNVAGMSGYRLGFNGATVYRNANFWAAAGSFNGSFSGPGSNGNYWSRTADSQNADYAYRLSFDNDSINPARGNRRYVGFSVRCVANY